MPRTSQRDQLLRHLLDMGGSVKHESNCVKLLHEQTGMERKSITSALLGLQERGLVERDTGQGGRKRTYEVRLTEAGQRRANLVPKSKPKPKPRKKDPPKPEPIPTLPVGATVRVVGAFITKDDNVEYVIENNGTRRLLLESGITDE